MKLRTMGFNVRYTDDPDGHSVAERAPRIFSIIEDYDPDIICFQEVTPLWIKPLRELDEKYEHVILFRDVRNLEGAPVFWNKERFEYVSCRQFWLNETPDRPNLLSWGSSHYRHCVRVTLRDKKSGRLIHAHSSHFDFPVEAQVNSAKVMIDQVKALGEGEIAICIADYNFAPDSPGDKEMKTFFREVRQEIAPESKQATFCNYQLVGDKPGWIIDHCFYSGKGIDAIDYEVITKVFDGKFASDHFGMIYDFEIK